MCILNSLESLRLCCLRPSSSPVASCLSTASGVGCFLGGEWMRLGSLKALQPLSQRCATASLPRMELAANGSQKKPVMNGWRRHVQNW